MNKTIKTFLVLSFITATCWAYLLGEYMGTVTFSRSTGSPGFQPASFSHSRSSTSSSSSSSKPASIDTSKINTGGGAVDVSKINLGFFSGGSSGDITAQSNSGTSGGTVDRTKSIDVSAYAKAYDGNIDKMIAAIKSDFLRTPTAGEYQAAAEKINSENKFSILSVAAVAELHSSWLTDYFEWTEGLTSKQIDEIVGVKIDEVAKEYGILPREARALLMEVDGIIAEQPGAPSSLIVRLGELSINDPLFVDAKENVFLQTAIAEAVPETSTSTQQSPQWWSDTWGGNPPTVMPSSGDWGASMNEAIKAAELAFIGGMTNPVMQARKSFLYGSCPGESYIAEGGYIESDDPLSMSTGWQPGAYIGEGSFMGNAVTNVTGNSAFETSASIQQSPQWWSKVWGGNPPTVMPSSGDWGTSMNEAIKAAEIAVGGTMTPVKQARQSFLTGSCPGEPYIAEGGYVGSDDWLSMSTGWQPGAHMGGGSHMGSVEGIVEISSTTPESATYWVSSSPISAYYTKTEEEKEIIRNKAEEFNNEVGTNISEEMMIMALGLAIVDKGLIVTDENIREVISSITLNEVEYYISMINKVAKEYSLTSSEATSVLKMHISDQRASNANYKLSEENDIIGSIEANKNTSRLLEIIQEAKAGGIPAVNVDLNRDGEINLIDSAILMSFWGKDSSQFGFNQSPDINQNGNVDLADFSIMMSYWNYAFK